MGRAAAVAHGRCAAVALSSGLWRCWRRVAIAAVALFCAVASTPAQIVRAANLSGHTYSGWVRTTVDVLPPHPAGHVGDVRYVLGRPVGRAVWALDVHLTLAAGAEVELDLSTATGADDWVLGPLPADPTAHFGGVVTVAGVPMQMAGIEADGAAYLCTLRARFGPMLATWAWLRWYPDTPGWCHAETITLASNPSVGAMHAQVPAGYRLAFGDAVVVPLGLPAGAPLIDAGAWLADGQGRAAPLTLVWPRHLPTPESMLSPAETVGGAGALAQWASAASATSWLVRAVGVRSTLWDLPAPLFPDTFDARAWVRRYLPTAVRLLHTWEPSPLGPGARSLNTGEFEDLLLHAGGEALQPGGLGADLVRYLTALKLHTARPCNHLEADGSALDPALPHNQTPRLLFWDGRPHWHLGVSPNQRGKRRSLGEHETSGYWGPDIQHDTRRTLTAAQRLTGSPALQWLSEHLQTVYMLQRTADPSLSVSHSESARDLGYEAMIVLDAWHDMADRARAQQTVDRWWDRCRRIWQPKMAGRDLFAIVGIDRAIDPRIGPGLGAQWWMESMASWLVDRAAATVGPAEMRPIALRVARRVFDTAWREEPQSP